MLNQGDETIAQVFTEQYVQAAGLRIREQFDEDIDGT